VNEEFYISIAGEIFDGYSVFDFYGRDLYFKHTSIKDQRNLHTYYTKYINIAKSRGVESEEDILKKVKDDGLWTDDDDLKISNLDLEVQNLKRTKESLLLPSQKKAVQDTINQKTDEWINLLTKRKEIVGKTAEDYASGMAAQEIIRYFVFDSKELNKRAFSQEEFDDLDDEAFGLLRKIQDSISNRLNELDIQKTVLRPFFTLYLSFCENPSDFFGRPLIDLSVYQLKMNVFGKVFHSIFQHVENIPEDIKMDPERLIAFSESKSDSSKAKKFIDEDSAASTVFGATTEDVKDLAGDNDSGVSLTEEIKKAGGKLDMEQMMKLAGH
jgi:hypothetical protein